jgi:tetratricopeptide (TPR) repeat protein
MDPETEEKLRALGYTGTIVASTSESRKIDPKDRIHLLELLSRAGRAMESKDYRYVVETAGRVLEEDANIVDAHFFAASAYLHLGEKEKALAEMMATIRLKPDHTPTLYNLAFFHQIEGKLTEAEYWYLQLLKYEPDHLIGTMNLVSLYRQRNQPQKGEPYLSKILRSYEQALTMARGAEARSNLGEKLAEIYYKTGNFSRSEALIRESIQLTPRRPMLHFHLAVIHEAKKEFDAAAREYAEETGIDPNNANAFLNLGVLYRKSGRLQEAISCFRRVIQLNEQFYPAYYRLAEVYLAANTNLEDALRLVETAAHQAPAKDSQVLLQAIRRKLKERQ